METAQLDATDVPSGSATARDGSGEQWSFVADSLWLLAAALLSTLVAVWVHELWNMSLHIPLNASGDGLSAQTVIRTAMEHGWVGFNPDIGAPFGSSLYDNSVIFGYATQLMIVKVLALFSSDASAVTNVLYILGYPLASATAYLVLRDLKFARAVSLVGAVLFATTYFHFMRGGGHLFLGLNYAVPVGCWLVFGALGHVDLFRRRPREGHRLLAWATPRSGLTIVACFVAGASEVYFAVFTLALLALVTPVLAIARGHVRAMVVPVLLMAAVGGSAVAVQMPQIIWHWQNGANATVSERAPFESELLSFKLADLVMPVPAHRIDKLNSIATEYRTATPLKGEGSSPALGGFATLGFLMALIAVAASALSRRSRPLTRRTQLLRDTGVLAALAFLVGTVGGFGTLVAYLFTPEVRGWNRISIFIVFFGLVAVAVALSWLRDRLRVRGGAFATLATPLILLIGAVGVWEQTSPRVPDYEGIAQAWRNDSRFVAEIEKTLPKGSQVMQLPYVPFPEHPPVHQLNDYEHLRAYVASDHLQWSYGSSKGREPEDWARMASDLPTAELVTGAAAAGFEGIYVDRRGYADGAATLLAELAAETRQKPLVSGDDQQYFFDLRPIRQRLTAAVPPAEVEQAGKEFTGERLHATFGDGFFEPESDGTTEWRWAGRSSTITIANGGSSATAGTLILRMSVPGDRTHQVTVGVAGERPSTVRVRGGRVTDHEVTLNFQPGVTQITLTTDASAARGDARGLHLQVFEAAAIPAEVAEVAEALDGRATATR